MAINKVVLGDQTLIDLTSDTVTPDTLAVGATAHDKTGASIVGTMEAGETSRFGATLDTFLGKVDANGVLQAKATTAANLIFTGVKDLAEKSLVERFYSSGYYNNPQPIESVSFPDLEQISGSMALDSTFCNNNRLKTALFPKLSKVSGYRAMDKCFYNCDYLESVSFPKLKIISGEYAFESVISQCDKLTSIEFPELESLEESAVFASAFYYCRKLTEALFPKLKVIGDINATSATWDGRQFNSTFNSTLIDSLSFPELTAIYITSSSTSNGTFSSNSTLTKIYLPKLTTITYNPNYTGDTSKLVGHKNIFYNCSKLTEIHFGAANQAAIEATEGYSTLWGRGAGKATVYFDL